MSKAVLISIKPEWCEKIASGEKTIEVRKTRPKLPTPFKVYIYCTRGSPYLNRHNGKLYLEAKDILGGKAAGLYERLSGRVIGEFVCDEVETYDDDTIHAFTHEDYSRWNDFDLDRACMHPEDFEHYANDSWLYGWHISDLKIYDKPKELSEFYRREKVPHGAICAEDTFLAPIYSPPQSWCYVEELQK